MVFGTAGESGTLYLNSSTAQRMLTPYAGRWRQKCEL